MYQSRIEYRDYFLWCPYNSLHYSFPGPITMIPFPSDEINEVHSIDIQGLVAARLEDMALQVEYLYDQRDYRSAELLRQEGLEMAEAYDNEVPFMFINDLSEARGG